MKGKVNLRLSIAAAACAVVLFLYIGAAHAFGVCVNSPQTDCSLGDGPPSPPSGGGTTFYPPRKSAAEIEAEMNQSNAHAFNNAGNRHYENGRYAEAIKDYEMALRFTPYDETMKRNLRNARNQLAWAQATRSNVAGNDAYKKGNLEDAVKHYRRALRNSPNDPVIKENLELTEREWNQQKEEKRQIKEADAEIRKGIDDLADSIAGDPAPPAKPAKSGKRGTKKATPFGIEATHDENTLSFMSAGDTVVPAKDRTELEAVAASGAKAGGVQDVGGTKAEIKEKTLSFMDSSAEHTRREAARPFVEGVEGTKMEPLRINGKAPSLPEQIASLPSWAQKQLKEDKEYPKLMEDSTQASKDLQEIGQKLETAAKKLETAQGPELDKLRDEQTKLKEQHTAAAKIKTEAEGKIREKIKTLSFHQEPIKEEAPAEEENDDPAGPKEKNDPQPDAHESGKE